MYLRCTILLVLILQAPAVLSQNVCNENTCYYNITSAIENASDGNTITVHGNHEEAVTVNKSITLTGNHSLLTAQSTYVLNITARNVTIANLSISNSGKGILVTNDSATLSNLNISTHGGDAHAIDVQRSNHTLIKNSAITTQNGSNNFGIYVRESSNATITNTTISTNGSNDNYAIFLQQNVRNVSITRNTLQTAGANGNDLALHLATQVGSITISENNISSLNGAFSIPIYLYDNVDDVVIQNNNITPAIGTQNSGIYMEQHLRDVLITGNRIYVRGNHSQGIVLDSAQEITITANNITLTENGSSITLMESVSETHSISIYNNYFYARTIINGSGNATLNTSLSVGENIIGGPSIGGNYYDNATSFSRTCTDSNEDGICDETLSIAGFIDYLPLATLPSNRCQTLRTNESTFTLNRSVQSAGTCFRLMGNSSTLECTQGSINHSLSLPEHGITIEGENVTIRNCTLYQKNSSNNAYNIYVTGNNARLENVTTNNSGNKNHGIAIAANYSSIVRSSVTAGSDFSHAILLNASSHSSVVNSSLHTKGGRESHVVASYNGAHNRIEGTRITSLAASFWNFGIYLFQGRNETIHNSSITTFSTGNFLQSKAYGVHVEKSNHTRVERVDVATSGTTTVNTGINIEESSNVSIEHARIRTNGTSDNYGVRAYRSTNVSIAHTTIATNGTLSSNIGIFLEEGVNNSILDNTSIATYGTGFNYGVLLYDNNNHNTLQNLTLLPGGSDGSNHGIYFETESRSNVVQSNTITTNTSESHGIYLFPSVNNTIRNNRVTAH